MLQHLIGEALRVTVILCATFNFFILVFLYERDGGSRRKMPFALAALLIAVGQLYMWLSAFSGSYFEWPAVASQVGLAVVLAASLGSVKRAATLLIDHCGGCPASRSKRG